MIFLMFKDFNNNFLTIRNPSQLLIDNAENLYPESIMKVYDFKTGELVVFYNENFKWIELEQNVNSARLFNEFCNNK